MKEYEGIGTFVFTHKAATGESLRAKLMKALRSAGLKDFNIELVVNRLTKRGQEAPTDLEVELKGMSLKEEKNGKTSRGKYKGAAIELGRTSRKARKAVKSKRSRKANPVPKVRKGRGHTSKGKRTTRKIQTSRMPKVKRKSK